MVSEEPDGAAGLEGPDGLLHALMKAETQEAKRAFMEAHAAALLDGQAEEALRAAAAKEPEGSGQRQRLESYAALLHQCQIRNISSAFQTLTEAKQETLLIQLAQKMTLSPDWHWLANQVAQIPDSLLKDGRLEKLLTTMVANLQAYIEILAEAAERGLAAAITSRLAELPPSDPPVNDILAMLERLKGIAETADPATVEERIDLTRNLLIIKETRNSLEIQPLLYRVKAQALLGLQLINL